MGKGDDDIKVLVEINVELQFSIDKLIEKLSQKKDSQEEALGEFNSTLNNVIEKLRHEKYSPDSLDIKIDWQEDPYHETEDLFVELDQTIKDVIVQNNVPQEVAREVAFNLVVYEEVAEKVVEMANDQDEALFDQEVAGDSLDDEEVEQRRPSKGLESPKKRWSRMKRQRKADKDPLM
ncbi:hypothetical protein Tco_1478053 [Tanacetum coccineum]